jgi:very-short-patch-repair endonuclease
VPLACVAGKRLALEIPPPAPHRGRVADFACPARKLAVELDGVQHVERHKADAARSAEIEAQEYRTIRFWNNDVSEMLGGVLQRIRASLEFPPPHPGPLRPRGRRGS